MYLPIGDDMSVRDKNVIGIFDLDTTTVTERGRIFLDRAEKEGQVVPWTPKSLEDMPKSYILTEIDRKSKIFISPISSATLLKRAKNVSSIAPAIELADDVEPKVI
jgi:hypothetical protein